MEDTSRSQTVSSKLQQIAKQAEDYPQKVFTTLAHHIDVDFLGFTFYWGKGLKGYWIIKKRTVRKRLSRFMKRIGQWCKNNLHEPIGEQHKILCSKLRGFYLEV